MTALSKPARPSDLSVEEEAHATEPPEAVIQGSSFTLVDEKGDVSADPDQATIEALLERKAFFWLDVHEPSAEDIATLGEIFSFHPLALEDSAAFGQRPKVDNYDTFAFLVIYGASTDEDGLVEVHCFSSDGYLVTVRHDHCPTFNALQRRYMARPDTLADRSMLLYHVVDGLTDSFFPALGELDDRIDSLQNEIFAGPREGQLQEIFAMKQRLVGLRRVITPQRDMFAQLVGRVVDLPGTNDETVRYFRDVYDHLIRLSDEIDSYRDLLTGSIDVYMSTVANRRDQIMKQLTIMASVFLPITFTTGFFGQNFGYMIDHLIDTRDAFIVGTAVQVAVVVAILAFFKKKEWL